MDSNSILSIAAIAVSLAASALGVVNHRRIRSNCCGTKLEASLDVESTTPPIKNPPNNVVDDIRENQIV